MPVPDISRPSKVEAKFLQVAVTTGTTTAFTVPADTIFRIRSVYVTNLYSTTQTFTMNIVRSATVYPYIPALSVTTSGSQNLVANDDALYLEPGDAVSCRCGTAGGTGTLHIVYESIT